jgi:hypothetical protein
VTALALASGSAWAQAVVVGPGFDQLGLGAPIRPFPVQPGNMSAPAMTAPAMGPMMMPKMPKMGGMMRNPAVDTARTQAMLNQMREQMGRNRFARVRMGQRASERSLRFVTGSPMMRSDRFRRVNEQLLNSTDAARRDLLRRFGTSRRLRTR